MIRVLDPTKFGRDALGFLIGDRIVAGWVRMRRDGEGCSAWVLWDRVTYLVSRRVTDRDEGVDAITNWIATVTSPEAFEQLPAILNGPWTDR